MTSCRWIAFALTDALSKTIVHFFPASGAAIIPYPAECKISIFSSNLERRSVILEGGRLGQPDGVRLEDAFPEIADGGIVLAGIEIELSTNQPKVDLSGSACIVEIALKGQSVRFQAKRADIKTGSVLEGRPGILLQDDRSVTSLVAVNGNSSELNQNLKKVVGADSQVKDWSVMLDSDSIVEIPLATDSAKDVLSANLASAVYTEKIPENAAFYLLYRDALTRQPQAVSVL